MRKPLQGLRNVIRFNWPYYAGAGIFLAILVLLVALSGGWARIVAMFLALLAALATVISLLVTLKVYDLSGFYRLEWLGELERKNVRTILNVNAGFDETSTLLESQFLGSDVVACDFFDAKRNTESSIARARKAYPSYERTISISSDKLPFETGSVAIIFAIMSAHEIRNREERNVFFGEISRIMEPNGRLVVVEHLRDFANIFAYNLGAFHFHSRAVWLSCFREAGLLVDVEKKLGPFLTAFFLTKNGNCN